MKSQTLKNHRIYAKVLNFGNTSVTLYMELRKHNVYTGEQETSTSTEIKFVRIDDEGNALPISERVKTRYNDRVKKFGKGLLSMEEKLEADEETKTANTIQ